MKNLTITARAVSIQLILLLRLGATIFKFAKRASGQSLPADEVKHDTRGQTIKRSQALNIDVNLALVNVTVTDPYSRIVTGLEPDNFRVFEDNVEQEVVNFSSEDVPISIGVILDLSGSMANKLGKAKEAALQFFKTANPQDEFFLVGFNERAQLLSPFTPNVEDLQSRMLSASAKGKTALLDAIYLGLSQMRGAHSGKRALLIISDGGDNNSRYTEKDIKRFVREADTQLYSIVIFDTFKNRIIAPRAMDFASSFEIQHPLTLFEAFNPFDEVIHWNGTLVGEEAEAHREGQQKRHCGDGAAAFETRGAHRVPDAVPRLILT